MLNPDYIYDVPWINILAYVKSSIMGIFMIATKDIVQSTKMWES